MRRDPADPIISRIDKDRRSGAEKARDAKVTLRGYLSTRAAIKAVAETDRVRHCEGALDAIRAALTEQTDAALASSIIASKAVQPIIAKGARARAEQAFSKLANPANDSEAA